MKRKITVLVFLFLSFALYASSVQLKMKDGKTFSYTSSTITTSFKVSEEPSKFAIKDWGFWEETYELSYTDYSQISKWLTDNGYHHSFGAGWVKTVIGYIWKVTIVIGKEYADKITAN